jgi:hypothetical protein
MRKEQGESLLWKYEERTERIAAVEDSNITCEQEGFPEV